MWQPWKRKDVYNCQTANNAKGRLRVPNMLAVADFATLLAVFALLVVESPFAVGGDQLVVV